MENNETKKTNNTKKILVGIIIVLVIALIVAIPFSIISLNGNKENKNNGLKGPKKVKEYECTKKGNVCSFEEMYKGVEVNIEVAKGKTYTFSMIANDKDKMTLMLQQNIVDEADWHSELINMKGPQTALQELNEKVQKWTNVVDIENYAYTDSGKKDLERICGSSNEEQGFKCPEDEYDTRCYNGLSINRGKLTLNFNLPKNSELEDVEPLTEGTIENVTAKARMITLEEFNEFNIDKGLPKWLTEGLDKNEGYWTLTSSPSMTTAYFQGAIAIVNNNNKASIESLFVADPEADDFKVGLRPVIEVFKK